jgi:hypothetical protein
MFGDFDFSDMFASGGGLQDSDMILAYLVSSLVNMGGAPMGVTLMVKGTVITGTLMSEREYLDTLSHILQAQVREALLALPDSERKMAESAFDLREFEEDFYPDDEDEAGEDDVPPELIHLHLKNPLIVSPQPSIGFGSGPLPVMRIPLAQIDGWMLGASIPDDLDDLVAPNGNSDIRH